MGARWGLGLPAGAGVPPGGEPITMELCEEMQEMGVLGTALLPQVFAQLRAPPRPDHAG